MHHSPRRFVLLLALGAFAVGARGGGDDDSIDLGDVAGDANETTDDACSDSDASSDDDGSSSEPGFGEFIRDDHRHGRRGADLSGGAIGTFPVEKVALVAVTDGDVPASRSYDGPATMAVSEHDTGGATSDPNARRMAVTFDGSLAGPPSDRGGEVEVSADVEWVMGCP